MGIKTAFLVLFGVAAVYGCYVCAVMIPFYRAGKRMSEGAAVDEIQPPPFVIFAMLYRQYNRTVRLMRGLGNVIRTTMASIGAVAGSLAAAASDAMAVIREAGEKMDSGITAVIDGQRVVVERVSSLRGETEALRGAVEQVSKGAQDQADRVSRLGAASEQMNAAVRTMAADIGNLAEKAATAGEQADEGERSAQRSAEALSQMRAAMARLEKRSREIADLLQTVDQVAEVIHDVAGQTKLLSLNAAIEAARAGEKGRGFAVVADEVGKLAQQAGEAVREVSAQASRIKSEIGELAEELASGGQDLEANSAQVLELLDRFSGIAEAVRDVGNSAQSLSATAEEVSAGVSEVTEQTQNLAALAEENSASAQEMLAALEGFFASLNEVAGQAERSRKSVEQVGIEMEEAFDRTAEGVRAADSLAAALTEGLARVRRETGRFAILGGMDERPLLLSALGLRRGDVMMRAYGPLAEYLTARLGRRVEFAPSGTYGGLTKALLEGEVDLAEVSAVMLARDLAPHGAEALVKFVLHGGETTYRSVIAVRAASRITELRDLEGRSFAYGDRGSTSGHYAPVALLARSGVRLGRVRFLGSHDRVAEAVLSDLVTAGALEDVVFDRYEAQGLRKLAETDPIPQFPVAARPGLDEGLKAAVREALLAAGGDAAVAEAMQELAPGFSGFAPAENAEYEAFRDMR